MSISFENCFLGDLVEKSGAFPSSIPIRIERYGYTDSTSAPNVSFIVPVHNQQALIGINLETMRRSSALEHEVIVVVDGCTDKTEDVARNWAESTARQGLTKGVTIAVVPEGVFETISDSIGAALAVGEYLIEVQADMKIWEHGFDRVMIRALEYSPSVIAVGGRGAHSFRLAAPLGRKRPSDFVGRTLREATGVTARYLRHYRPTIVELYFSDSIGRVGNLIECKIGIAGARRPLFVHESIMRGPIAIRRADFIEMGGLDTERFFLGNDDHDFAMRALVHLDRRVGFLPIGFDSPMGLGTTRAKRSPEAASRFNELKRYYAVRYADSALAIHVGKIRPPRRYIIEVPVEI